VQRPLGLTAVRRPELRRLAQSVRLTDVLITNDLSIATLLWSLDEIRPRAEIAELGKQLDLLRPAMRNVVARKVNIRLCPQACAQSRL
jgi:ribosome-binding factor A